MKSGYDFPITFNPHKHHFGFLTEQINKWQDQDWLEVEKELKYIGNNLIDLYYGKLTVEQITKECYDFFQKEKITNAEKFADWLHPFEYRKISLSDRSLWIIKQGTDMMRFIHIHPAKNSPFSIRIRATTLKTVVALKIQQGSMGKDMDINVQTVNRIRTEYLGLSPVKALEKNKGIARLWSVFRLI